MSCNGIHNRNTIYFKWYYFNLVFSPFVAVVVTVVVFVRFQAKYEIQSFLGLRIFRGESYKNRLRLISIRKSEKSALYSITKHDHVDMAVISLVFFFRARNNLSTRTVQMANRLLEDSIDRSQINSFNFRPQNATITIAMKACDTNYCRVALLLLGQLNEFVNEMKCIERFRALDWDCGQ